jgi:hypothetical protein
MKAEQEVFSIYFFLSASSFMKLNLAKFNFFMQRLVNFFCENYFLQHQTQNFKKLLYVFVMLRCLCWLGNYNVLFGHNSISYSSFQSLVGIKNTAFILLNNSSSSLALAFILFTLLFCFSNLALKYFQFLFDICIWFFMLNLHNKIYSTLTSGDALLNQFLFFNIFILIEPKIFVPKKSMLLILINNTAVLALIIQICLLYFISGLVKIFDADWITGNAMLKLSFNHQFNLYDLHFNSAFSKIILIFINYVVVAYQVFFPALVFIKKIKKPVLLTGIAIHLGIIIFMGLFWFGTIMILSYVLFWPNKLISNN